MTMEEEDDDFYAPEDHVPDGSNGSTDMARQPSDVKLAGVPAAGKDRKMQDGLEDGEEEEEGGDEDEESDSVRLTGLHWGLCRPYSPDVQARTLISSPSGRMARRRRQRRE